MNERSVVVRLRAEVADFKRQLDDAAKAVDRVGKQSERTSQQATTAMGQLTQSASKHRAQWDQAGRTLLGFGTVTVGALGLAAKAAVDWESDWTGVLKTVDGTPEQLQGVEDGLRGLARTLPSTHHEIAAVAEAAGQLGVKTKDIVGFTKTMIDLGETTNLSADEAATSIAQLMNVMRTAPQDVGRVGAALVALGNAGASTERDIIQMAQRMSASAKIIGLSEADVLGLANAMASMGIEVEAGGSAMSRVMTDIAKAVAQNGDDLAAWARVSGLTAADFARRWRADPADALLSVTEGLGRMQAAGEDVFTTLDDLGQADVRTSRALLSMAASGDMARESIQLGNVAWAEQTALLEEAEKRYDTTTSKIDVARNSINDAAITIGDSFLPIIAAASEQLAGFAEFIGSIPQPLLIAGSGLAAVAGGAALAGGAFLMLFPRLIETIAAFKTMRQDMPRLASGLGRVGSAAITVGSAATAVLATAAAVGSLIDAATRDDAAPKVNALEAAIRRLAATRDVDSLNDQFDNFGTFLGLARVEATDLGSALDTALGSKSWTEFGWLTQEVTKLGGSLPGVTSSLELVEQRFSSLDDRLAAMVANGDVETVRAALAAIYEEAESKGYTVDQINGLFDDTVDALFGVEEGTDAAATASTGLTEAFNAVTGATEQLTEAQVAWRQEMSDLDAQFVDVYGAYDTLVQKNKDAAQAAADATDSTDDSWTDFIDDFPTTVQGYLDELQSMVDAQNAWEVNMLLLSGRVSQGTLDELARMGPEGAPLVAQLVDASDEELQRMEALFGERAGNATGLFATTLDTSAPIIAEAAAKLGDEAAREIATKLAAGTTTVEEIMAEYGLKIESLDPEVTVTANTTPATWEIDEFIRTQQNRSIQLHAQMNVQERVFADPDYSPARSQWSVARAGGGPVFGPGTETSDSIPARLSTNEHVWAAAEVRGAGGHAAVAGLRAAARNGLLSPVQTMRFADGGSPSWSGVTSAATAPAFPTDGWSISGRLELGGDGIARLVDGRIAQAQASRTSAVSRGAR